MTKKPALTATHMAICELYDEPDRLPRHCIADLVGLSVSQLERHVTFLREHGLIIDRPKMLRYESWMDPYIKEKF